MKSLAAYVSVMFNRVLGLNLFAILSVLVSSAISIYLFRMYQNKKLSAEDICEDKEKLNELWFAGFVGTGLVGQGIIENYLDFEDAIFNSIGGVLGDVIFFFVIYGVLTLIGVDKENKIERCNKSFKGIVILCAVGDVLYYLIYGGL